MTALNKRVVAGSFALIGAVTIVSGSFVAHADPTATSQLTQSITAGAISTDIRDDSGNVLNNPSFSMSSATVSNTEQTVTGTFGSNSQRITVDNPGAANGGWSLAWNATTPGTGVWTNGSDTYAYNDTAANGLLTVNPAAGTITAVTGGLTGITLGSQADFSGTLPVTLVTASAASADVWNGYFTGIGLSQTIPASTPVGSYTIDMTQTVTAT